MSDADRETLQKAMALAQMVLARIVPDDEAVEQLEKELMAMIYGENT